MLILFCAGISYAFGQDTAYQFYKKIPYPVTYFATNLAGELYTINSDNRLKKYNINGDSVGVFNDVKKFGKLSYVRAQNPWKTILFYENFQTIVLLDKYLNNLGNINLRDKNIFNVKAVASSYDNNIWVFDGREFKIKKLDDNGNILMVSDDFRQLFEDVPTPEWIGDSDGLLYLYDPAKGFYVFDYYGAFKVLLPFKNWKSEYVNKKDMIGFDDNFYYQYTPPVPVPADKPLPSELKNADLISISAQKIYVLKDKALSIFNVK
jgi:hypothetical protein